MEHDTTTTELIRCFEREDPDGAREIMAREFQKPLSEKEAGAYRLQLVRVYLRYMAQLNEQYATTLDEASNLLSELNRQERRLNEVAKGGEQSGGE